MNIYQNRIYPTSGQPIDAPASPKNELNTKKSAGKEITHPKPQKKPKWKGHKMLINWEKVWQYHMITWLANCASSRGSAILVTTPLMVGSTWPRVRSTLELPPRVVLGDRLVSSRCGLTVCYLHCRRAHPMSRDWGCTSTSSSYLSMRPCGLYLWSHVRPLSW